MFLHTNLFNLTKIRPNMPTYVHHNFLPTENRLLLFIVVVVVVAVRPRQKSDFGPSLVENLLQLLVRTVDNTPTEKGSRAVHTYALVDVPQLPIALVIHLS